MPETGQKRQLALDANILIDLAAEERFAQEFRGFFQLQGFSLFIPPDSLTGTRLFCCHWVPGGPHKLACAQSPFGHCEMGFDAFPNEARSERHR
jgi:hypothetical protein